MITLRRCWLQLKAVASSSVTRIRVRIERPLERQLQRELNEPGIIDRVINHVERCRKVEVRSAPVPARRTELGMVE